MTTAYNIGDNRKFTATFTDSNGANVDPTSVTATVRAPDGTTSTPSVNNDAVGVYSINFEFALPGRHIIRFLGDGAANAAQEVEVWARHIGAI